MGSSSGDSSDSGSDSRDKKVKKGDKDKKSKKEDKGDKDKKKSKKDDKDSGDEKKKSKKDDKGSGDEKKKSKKDDKDDDGDKKKSKKDDKDDGDKKKSKKDDDDDDGGKKKDKKSKDDKEKDSKDKKDGKDKKDSKDKKGDKSKHDYSDYTNIAHGLISLLGKEGTSRSLGDTSTPGSQSLTREAPPSNAALPGEKVPSSQQANQAPPSGYRIPLTTDAELPTPAQLGPPPSTGADGSPVYIASALLEGSVYPCKIAPAVSPLPSVAIGGTETLHHGRFDLLPFDPATMEFVKTSGGVIPEGKRPVEGGYNDFGKLYHILGTVEGVRVPGKTGEYSGTASVTHGGKEHLISDSYELLCWR